MCFESGEQAACLHTSKGLIPQFSCSTVLRIHWPVPQDEAGICTGSWGSAPKYPNPDAQTIQFRY